MTTLQPLQPPQVAPKRPRLSLQIKTCGLSATTTTTRTGLSINPADPTTFNTLSNKYVSAIERSTPEPLTAINTLQNFSITTPIESKKQKLKLRVTTPYIAAFPETPTSSSPPKQLDTTYPSVLTSTPPLSAGPVDSKAGDKVFSFSTIDTIKANPSSTRSPVETRLNRRHLALPSTGASAPYHHPRSLHSILRNSPLPPRTAIPASPRRPSLRLHERRAKRVGYNNPLTQDIVTNKYIKSHIELLIEEASPATPGLPIDTEIDLAQAFTGNEIEDGGQTPGPFEDMRRRLAGLEPSSPQAGGIRKRKKKEKKRQWVWTIGVKDEEEEDDDKVGGAIAALRAEAAAATAKAAGLTEAEPTVPMPLPEIRAPDTPTESLGSMSGADSASEAADIDVDMSDVSSVASEDTGRIPSPEYGLKPKPAKRPKLKLSVAVPKKHDNTAIPELVRL